MEMGESGHPQVSTRVEIPEDASPKVRRRIERKAEEAQQQRSRPSGSLFKWDLDDTSILEAAESRQPPESQAGDADGELARRSVVVYRDIERDVLTQALAGEDAREKIKSDGIAEFVKKLRHHSTTRYARAKSQWRRELADAAENPHRYYERSMLSCRDGNRDLRATENRRGRGLVSFELQTERPEGLSRFNCSESRFVLFDSTKVEHSTRNPRLRSVAFAKMLPRTEALFGAPKQDFVSAEDRRALGQSVIGGRGYLNDVVTGFDTHRHCQSVDFSKMTGRQNKRLAQDLDLVVDREEAVW